MSTPRRIPTEYIERPLEYLGLCHTLSHAHRTEGGWACTVPDMVPVKIVTGKRLRDVKNAVIDWLLSP